MATVAYPDFTQEKLDEALKLVNGKYQLEGGHFEIARENHHAGTLKVFKEDFFNDEPICRSLQLQWSVDVETFVMAAVQQNLSLIAVDDATGDIMGIRISAPTNKEEELEQHNFKDERFRLAINFIQHVKDNFDFYNRYGVNEAVEFVAIAVTKKYRQKGLGTKLMSAAVDLVHFCKPGTYIKSLATSNFSAKIFEKVGFEKVYEIQYKDYIVDGEVVLNNTGVHKRTVAFAIKA